LIRRLLLILVVALAGCSLQRPDRGAVPDRDSNRAQLQQLAHWQAVGRIAFKSRSGGEQGRLRWTQAGAVARIRLSGPFGAGAVEILWEPEALTVTDKRGSVTHAVTGPDAAERFIAAQLGWSFPAGSVRYWMLGVPDPRFDSTEQRDADGRLTGLQQQGWSLSFEGFAVQETYRLPRKLVMRNGDLRVRLVIDDWSLPAN